eukprot:954234-Prymnesium_polylepis.1
MAFPTVGNPGVRLFCYNCNTIGHAMSTCSQAKHKCEECGVKGHLAKWCFVRNDKPLPSHMTAETVKSITAKRAAFKLRSGQRERHLLLVRRL